MLTLAVLVMLLACSHAFSPMRSMRRSAVATPLKMGSENPGPTYWETAAPPSSVLGIGEKIPSGVFGPLSLVAFVVGTFCVHESNIFGTLSATTVYPLYVLGSALVPISWGMHVAAWIQKQNGK